MSACLVIDNASAKVGFGVLCVTPNVLAKLHKGVGEGSPRMMRESTREVVAHVVQLNSNGLCELIDMGVSAIAL